MYSSKFLYLCLCCVTLSSVQLKVTHQFIVSQFSNALELVFSIEYSVQLFLCSIKIVILEQLTQKVSFVQSYSRLNPQLIGRIHWKLNKSTLKTRSIRSLKIVESYKLQKLLFNIVKYCIQSNRDKERNRWNICKTMNNHYLIGKMYARNQNQKIYLK